MAFSSTRLDIHKIMRRLTYTLVLSRALDFDGNMERILESCRRAKDAGASYRLGPELEISGYGCEDHFLESDTFAHCWESLAELLEQGATDNGLLCDFGMPVLFAGARYNCRILAMNRKILLIR